MEDTQDLMALLKLQRRPEYVDVEVQGFRDADGAPLKVRCPRPDRLALAEQMRANPGARPAEAPQGDVDPEDNERQVLELAPRLIGNFAAVQLPDGSWRCPAFTFADPPAPGLLDGRELTYPDLMNLSIAIMRVGGYLGGSAIESFSGERGGSGGSR